MYIKTVTHLFIKMDENLGGCAFYVDDIELHLVVLSELMYKVDSFS